MHAIDLAGPAGRPAGQCRIGWNGSTAETLHVLGIRTQISQATVNTAKRIFHEIIRAGLVGLFIFWKLHRCQRVFECFTREFRRWKIACLAGCQQPGKERIIEFQCDRAHGRVCHELYKDQDVKDVAVAALKRLQHGRTVRACGITSSFSSSSQSSSIQPQMPERRAELHP